MRLRTFLLLDITTAAVTRAIFIYLGFSVGAPAVRVVEAIAKYSWYISIVLLAGIFFNLWRQSRAQRLGPKGTVPEGDVRS
jgi:membrane protein DedA with SNARE-associated domain